MVRSIRRSAGMPVFSLLLLASLCFCTGCAIHSNGKLEVTEYGPSLEGVDLRGKKLWVRTFEHTGVSDVSSVWATGSAGTIGGTGVTRTKSNAPPRMLLGALEETGLFRSVTPTVHMGSEPDLILEGSVSVDCSTPWWSWVQLVDLWIHAWFFPTLGRNWETVGEISLYDKEHILLHRWKFRQVDEYVSNVWWMFSHGGADDKGFDVECQNETVCKAVRNIFDNISPVAEMRCPIDGCPDEDDPVTFNK